MEKLLTSPAFRALIPHPVIAQATASVQVMVGAILV